VKGSVFKRCTCPSKYGKSGKKLACKKDHGSWYFAVDIGRDPTTGKRLQHKEGGFRTEAEAEEAMAATITALTDGTYAYDGGITVGVFLPTWIEDQVSSGRIRVTTARGYCQHIRDHLIPHLGHLRLRDLRTSHVTTMPRAVAKGQPDTPTPSGATVRRVHSTLRSALASALRQQLVSHNAAVNVELPAAPRTKVRPWEPAELGTFLDSLGGHRLAPLFELIAATGLRRGEACGLRWSDVDLARGVLVVRQQLVQVASGAPPCPSCGKIHAGHTFGPPKTASGEARMVELDGGTAGVLLAHRLTQDIERAEWGDAYTDHDLVFAREDGNPLPLDAVTKTFTDLAERAGLRRVRLHDLRHGAASLMLAAGVDLALVSKRLGHSSVAITADTYSHLLEGVGREAAERAAALVPRNRGDQPATNPPDSAGVPTPRKEENTRSEVVGPRGIEPRTRGLKVRCSAD